MHNQRFADPTQVVQKLRAVGYFADEALGSAVMFANHLTRPLLLEGPAGSGKTELAKSLATAVGARLIRMQCYEGLDESKLLYDWNYHKQILRLQVSDAEADESSWPTVSTGVYSDEFLLERPLLAALRSEDPVVLLIDEVDRLGPDTEAILLEFLSEYEVTIPELGTVTADRGTPFVVLTSNMTRQMSDGLKRRCINAHLEYPSEDREREIVLERVPEVTNNLGVRVVEALRSIEALEQLGAPSVSDAIEWARTVVVLGADTIGLDVARQALDLLEWCENNPASASRNAVAWELAPTDAIERGQTVLDMVSAFARELRSAGVTVSLSEHIDAIEALQHVPLLDREAVRAALAATLISNNRHWNTFKTIFDVYFSLAGIERRLHEHNHHHRHDERDARLAQLLAHAAAHEEHRLNGFEDLSAEQLAERLLLTVLGSQGTSMGPLAREAVRRYGSMDTSDPLAYHLYKTLRGLDIEALLDRLMKEAPRPAPHDEQPMTKLDERLVRDEMEARLDDVREQIEAEIRRRLAAESGGVGDGLFGGVVEDVDFALASRDELANMHAAIEPLTRALSARLTRKRKNLRRGRLDIRKTVRHSMSYGGVLAEPKFKNRKPFKPEVVVLADISGSVAAFTRFTLHFVYAMNSAFSKVRTFVFIDGLEEVTELLASEDDVVRAVQRIITESDNASIGACSDYGRVFERFREEQGATLTARSTLLILGDARTNNADPNAAALKDLTSRARNVFWLNPEPADYWDTRDSVVEHYSPHCEMHECRNLRQLEAFVELIA